MVQLVAYGERAKRGCQKFTECLDASRRTFLGEFASFVVLSEVGIARLLWEHRRLNDGRRRSVRGLAGVDASSALAGGDEVGGALVGNDLEVVGSTGV